MSDQDQEAAQNCVHCGASNTLEARFCGVCGRELFEGSVASEGAMQERPDTSLWGGSAPDTWEPGNPNPGSSDLGEMEAAAQAPVEGAMRKRCAWCSGLNPWAAVACEVCGAHFPVPEQDEAFRRAAEERIRQDEESLNFWRQRRRGWRRFLIG